MAVNSIGIACLIGCSYSSAAFFPVEVGINLSGSGIVSACLRSTNGAANALNGESRVGRYERRSHKPPGLQQR